MGGNKRRRKSRAEEVVFFFDYALFLIFSLPTSDKNKLLKPTSSAVSAALYSGPSSVHWATTVPRSSRRRELDQSKYVMDLKQHVRASHNAAHTSSSIT